MNLDKSNNYSNNHHGVDDGVIEVDYHDGDELIVRLTDEGEVEDESDGECHQAEKSHEQTDLGV